MMPHVIRPDERLAALVKPALEPVSQFFLQREDCLVMCAGFEERSLGILRNALKPGANFKILIIEYLPFLPQNRLDEARSLCAGTDVKPEQIIYDRENPAGFDDILLEKIQGVKGRIMLDVSAMSRLLIVQCIVALKHRDRSFENCNVVYSEAAEYLPRADEVESALRQSGEDPLYSIMLLSSGVFDITIVPELSSTAMAGNQTRLVFFPTFSTDQLIAVRNELAPSRFTYIHGVPPDPENQWRTAAIVNINGLNLSPRESILASTLDYRDTLDALLQIYRTYSERERILVSPTGSKMQAVAVGIFRAFIEDVQIVYPTPKEFRSPDNYTLGVGKQHSLNLDPFLLK